MDSLAFSANFWLGVVNAPIPGWDFLLPWGIFSGISISKFPDMLPLHSASIAADCAALCEFPNSYDDMVQCDTKTCQNWFHYKCAGLINR